MNDVFYDCSTNLDSGYELELLDQEFIGTPETAGIKRKTKVCK